MRRRGAPAEGGSAVAPGRAQWSASGTGIARPDQRYGAWGETSPLIIRKGMPIYRQFVDSLVQLWYDAFMPNFLRLRFPYQQYRARFPYRQYNIILFIIGANLLIYLLIHIIPASLGALALQPAAIISRGAIWQFVTYMFLHANLSHIFFNMLALFFFGTQTERILGSYEFLCFYLVVGTFSGIASFIFYIIFGSINTVLLGASGAVFGVLFAFAALRPHAMIYILGFIPVRAPWLVIGYAVIEILSQVSGRGGNVAHITHLAGFLFAYLYFYFRLGLDAIRIFRDHLRR